MTKKKYFDTIDKTTYSMIFPLIKYIETKYQMTSFSELYSEKSRMPTWRLHNSYVAIACRKNYISLYFGTEKAVQAVLELEPTCKALKGCVKLSYNKEIPYEALYRGIDVALIKKDGS